MIMLAGWGGQNISIPITIFYPLVTNMGDSLSRATLDGNIGCSAFDDCELVPSVFYFYCINISYLVDRCICPAHSRSRQTLEKNASSWALARTGSVLFTRQVAV